MTVKTIRGNITASKATLNLLSILVQEAAVKYENESCEALAEESRVIGHEIYVALEATGYYKEVFNQ